MKSEKSKGDLHLVAADLTVVGSKVDISPPAAQQQFNSKARQSRMNNLRRAGGDVSLSTTKPAELVSELKKEPSGVEKFHAQYPNTDIVLKSVE